MVEVGVGKKTKNKKKKRRKAKVVTSAERMLQASVIGGIVQPVRLYYHVADEQGLSRALGKLKCVDHDIRGGRWVWLYDDEARKLKIENGFSSIPKQARPIVIGSFYRKAQDAFVLDVRTIERAGQAIPFFDKHVPRSVAKVTHAAIVNRLFEAKEMLSPNFDSLFRDPTEIDPEKAVESLTSGAAALLSVQEHASRRLPDVEKFPIHFYEDGIEQFRTTLIMRQMIAMEHWRGNTDYSFDDLLKQTVQGLDFE